MSEMSWLAGAAMLLAGFSAGIAGGWRLGAAARGLAGRYWALSAAAFVGCMALDFAGLIEGWRWVSLGALGLMAGLLTGLRYGFTDTVGKLRRVTDAEDRAGVGSEEAAAQPHDNEFTPRRADA